MTTTANTIPRRRSRDTSPNTTLTLHPSDRERKQREGQLNPQPSTLDSQLTSRALTAARTTQLSHKQPPPNHGQSQRLQARQRRHQRRQQDRKVILLLQKGRRQQGGRRQSRRRQQRDQVHQAQGRPDHPSPAYPRGSLHFKTLVKTCPRRSDKDQKI